MSDLVRKQIYILEQQNIIIKRLAKLRGVSEAEVIRQAINSQSTHANRLQRDLKAWENERQFIQSLIEQGSVDGGRRWKREDLYDRHSG